MFDREQILNRDNWSCQRCGCTDLGKLGIAHRIKQGKQTVNFIKKLWPKMTKKYIEDEIINHEFNVVVACNEGCNDSYNIFYNEVERNKLLAQILTNLEIRKVFEVTCGDGR